MNILVLSTVDDLHEHREAVARAIRRTGHTESLPILPQSSEGVRQGKELVAASDAVVVLVAHRQGWGPSREEGGDGESSLLRLLYLEARKRSIPVFTFVIAPDVEWPKPYRDTGRASELLGRFKAELERHATGFRSPEDLALQLEQRLATRPDTQGEAKGDTPSVNLRLLAILAVLLGALVVGTAFASSRFIAGQLAFLWVLGFALLSLVVTQSLMPWLRSSDIQTFKSPEGQVGGAAAIFLMVFVTLVGAKATVHPPTPGNDELLGTVEGLPKDSEAWVRCGDQLVPVNGLGTFRLPRTKTCALSNYKMTLEVKYYDPQPQEPLKEEDPAQGTLRWKPALPNVLKGQVFRADNYPAQNAEIRLLCGSAPLALLKGNVDPRGDFLIQDVPPDCRESPFKLQILVEGKPPVDRMVQSPPTEIRIVLASTVVDVERHGGVYLVTFSSVPDPSFSAYHVENVLWIRSAVGGSKGFYLAKQPPARGAELALSPILDSELETRFAALYDSNADLSILKAAHEALPSKTKIGAALFRWLLREASAQMAQPGGKPCTKHINIERLLDEAAAIVPRDAAMEMELRDRRDEELNKFSICHKR